MNDVMNGDYSAGGVAKREVDAFIRKCYAILDADTRAFVTSGYSDETSRELLEYSKKGELRERAESVGSILDRINRNYLQNPTHLSEDDVKSFTVQLEALQARLRRCQV